MPRCPASSAPSPPASRRETSRDAPRSDPARADRASRRPARVRRRLAALGDDVPRRRDRHRSPDSSTSARSHPSRRRPGLVELPTSEAAGRLRGDPRHRTARRARRLRARCRADARDRLPRRRRADGVPAGAGGAHRPRRPRRRLLAAREGLAGPAARVAPTTPGSPTESSHASGSSPSARRSSPRERRTTRSVGVAALRLGRALGGDGAVRAPLRVAGPDPDAAAAELAGYLDAPGEPLRWRSARCTRARSGAIAPTSRRATRRRRSRGRRPPCASSAIETRREPHTSGRSTPEPLAHSQ